MNKKPKIWAFFIVKKILKNYWKIIDKYKTKAYNKVVSNKKGVKLIWKNN